MKLLLTSAGITNSLIAGSLMELSEKLPQETKIGFIPTAANVEKGNKDWFIAQLTNLHLHGYTWVDVVDPSADNVEWKKRLNEVDVIFVGGGNTFHLLSQARQRGIDVWLKDALHSKVYVGVSAGSILATATIEVCTITPSDENIDNLTDLAGLGLVDFEIEPHCDQIRFETMRKYAKEKARNLYAIDDQTAIQVVDGKIEVVSQGQWHKFYELTNS